MKRILRSGVVVATFSLLTGCLWQGYISPKPSTMIAITPNCPSLGVQNLSQEQSEILLEAVAEACKVVHSDLFLVRMSQRSFRERCIDDAMIEGADVVQALRTELPNFSILVRKPSGAVAQTHGKKMRMAIGPARVNSWLGDKDSQSALIGTLVHEWTHMFMKEDGYPRFQDRGSSEDESDDCFRGSLVSYQTGDIAKSVFQSP